MIKYISSNAVVGRFMRDFKPTNAAFEQDAIEWIAEALDIMHLAAAEVSKSATFTVNEHRTKIPCDVIAICGVEVCNIDGSPIPNAQYIPYNGAKLIEHISDEVETETYRFYEHRGNFLHFKFETGLGRIYYKGLPVDECGFPLIPDSAKVSNALLWYIAMKYLMQGNIHPIFSYQDVEARWELHYPRAQNDIKHVTPEKMGRLLRNWVNLIPRIDRHKDFFTEQQYSVDFTDRNFDISEFTGPATWALK